MKIKPMKFLALAGFVYRLLLRNIIKQAIDDPDNNWDEAVIRFLDTVFGYTKGS